MEVKISLFLMTSKGYHVLKSIIDNKLIEYLDLIIIGKDNHIKKDYSVEIEGLCKSNKIDCCFKNEFNKYKKNKSLNIAIAISWRWMINANDVKELFVIHDSLLPKYRGFSPLVNQLIQGEKTIGATLIRADNSYDTGNIILQESINISYPIKIQEAIELVERLYATMVCDFIKSFALNEKLKERKQNNAEATYSLWRDEEDYFIDWNKSSEEIFRFVNAVGYPYEGAKSYLNKKDLVIIEEVEKYSDVNIVNRDVGKVIFMENNHPVIVCGEGLLKVISYKRASNSDNNEIQLKKFRSRFY